MTVPSRTLAYRCPKPRILHHCQVMEKSPARVMGVRKNYLPDTVVQERLSFYW